MRHDGRQANELRPMSIQRDFIETANHSVLIAFGKTRVICSATVEASIPRFLKDTGRGWITAEYAMLPTATSDRNRREVTKGRQSGRTMEIQRLIGRSLRAAVDLDKLGERSIMIDCDIIQADGGTRTTAITGGMVVLNLAIQSLLNRGLINEDPILNRVSAISVGLVNGQPVLDLDYVEDSSADVDLNLVMTEDGRFIEIQGTAEKEPFTSEHLTEFLELGRHGIASIFQRIHHNSSATV